MIETTRRDFALLSLGAAAFAAWPAASRAAEDWRLGVKTPPKTLDGDLKLIDGRLPPDLQGAFYRVGPAQFERAGERLGHWFDGDGMIQRFAIANGRVRHRGRFIDTPTRRAEEKASRRGILEWPMERLQVEGESPSDVVSFPPHEPTEWPRGPVMRQSSGAFR